MASHSITVGVQQTELGVPQASDGIMGIVSQAVAVAGTFLLNTPYLLTSITDLENLGVTAAYDAASGLAFHQQVSEFYAEAGAGALLWVMGISTTNAFAAWVPTYLSNFIQATGAANPANQVKMVGLCYSVPTALQSAADFPADVAATTTALQTLIGNSYSTGLMFAAILDGANMSSTVTPATIGTQATKSDYGVALCITSTLGNGVSQVGMALGRNAKISIGRNMSNAKDGAVALATAYLTNSVLIQPTGTLTVGHTYYVTGGTVLYNGATYQSGQTFVAVTGFTTFSTADTGYVLDNGTPVQNLNSTYVNQLGTKQYLFVRTLYKKAGFYWNDGGTCVAATNSFSDLAYNRVINHLVAGVLDFFTGAYGDTPPTVPSTGDLDPVWIDGMEQTFYDQYIGPLSQASGTGDIVDGKLIITGDDFATNPNPIYTLSIIRKSDIGNITGTVQFVATL